jgi:hypothetical protein
MGKSVIENTEESEIGRESIAGRAERQVLERLPFAGLRQLLEAAFFGYHPRVEQAERYDNHQKN